MTDNDIFKNIPESAAEYIKLIIKKMRYRKKIRRDVQNELIAHFEDALQDCQTDQEKEALAKELIENFGNPKMLGKLARRAKKRCRPLWKKTIIKAFQAIGIIILYFVFCFGYLMIGSPAISTNYVEWLNDYVSNGRDETLNCKKELDEAANSTIKMPKWLSETDVKWPSDFNETQMDEFKDWLSENTSALNKLESAIQKPYYWNVYDVNESNFMAGGVFNKPFEIMSKYRHLAMTLNWQIRYMICNDKIDDAVDSIINLCSIAQRMQGNGLLIEQMVGISIEAVGLNVISESLERADFSMEQLEKLQFFLQASRDNMILDISAEKAFIYDFIQRSFTDDGHGNGRPIRGGIGFAGKNRKEIILNTITFDLPDKKEVLAQVDDLYEFYIQILESNDVRNIDARRIDEKLQNSPFIMQLLAPAYGKIASISCRLKTHKDASIAMLAILRYQKQFGQLPDDLKKVVDEGLLKQVPIDPFSNKPIIYKRVDNDFILYSVGINFIDDGGRMGISKHTGKPKMWNDDDGDAVFWPVLRK